MSPDLSQIRGIVLDLWNTICYSDYEPNPMILIAEALGIADRPGWKKTIERGMMTRPHPGIREGLEALERETGRSIQGGEEARALLIRRWNEACAATRLYEDALPALTAVRGRYRLGLLSNTQSFDLDFIRSEGISRLMDVVCLSCDLGRLKPDPLLFAAAADRLGLPVREILMIGDSVEEDVQGAIGAGFAAVHLNREGNPPPVPGAAGAVRLLTEISSLLASPPRGRG